MDLGVDETTHFLAHPKDKPISLSLKREKHYRLPPPFCFLPLRNNKFNFLSFLPLNWEKTLTAVFLFFFCFFAEQFQFSFCSFFSFSFSPFTFYVFFTGGWMETDEEGGWREISVLVHKNLIVLKSMINKLKWLHSPFQNLQIIDNYFCITSLKQSIFQTLYKFS